MFLSLPLIVSTRCRHNEAEGDLRPCFLEKHGLPRRFAARNDRGNNDGLPRQRWGLAMTGRYDGLPRWAGAEARPYGENETGIS